MTEQRVAAMATTEPLAMRQVIREAAGNGRTAIDEESGAVYVLGYDDVQKLLLEPKLNGVGLSIFDLMGIKDGPLRDWYGGLMFTNEGRPHHRLRSLVGKAFSPRSVEALRPVAASIVEERLVRLRAAGGGDLVDVLADVPMQVMCSLLGVPKADVPAFISWVNALGPTFGFMTPEQIATATSSIIQLLTYTTDLCERRSRTPADDLISALIAAEHDGDRLSRKETAAMIANLLVGGHDTTSSQIACTLLTLIERPDALQLALDEPGLLPAMINETIRFEPGITMAPRTVVAPLDVCGVERPAGTLVFCTTMTANRDPGIWRNPDVFEPRRFAAPDSPRLLTFGGGPHHCLGAWLAHLTLEETVRGVAAVRPSLAVPAASIEWIQSLGVNPATLPVTIH